MFNDWFSIGPFTVHGYGVMIAIGILVAVLHQVLVRAGREDQAMMTTLAGLVIVLSMVIKEISSLFQTVRTLFDL